jgi:hypothetical protein
VKANYTRKPKAGGDSLNIVRVMTGSDCGAQAKAPRLLSAHYAFSLELFPIQAVTLLYSQLL